MKKRLLILFISLITLFALTSCTLFEGLVSVIGGAGNSGSGAGSNDGSGSNSGDGSEDSGNSSGDAALEEDCIYSPTSQVFIVRSVNSTDKSFINHLNTIINTISAKTGKTVNSPLDDESTVRAHEIVVGDTEREISKEAKRQLAAKIAQESEEFAEQGVDRNDITGYAVYSDGSSVAVIWEDFQISEIAVDFFTNTYLTDNTLKLAEGFIKTEIFSLSAYLEEREDTLLEEKWAAMAEAIPQEYREDIIREFRNLYDLYTDDMVVWLANLYDPDIGGWYHSNSARDDTQGFKITTTSGTKTVQYMPDIENTYVALNLVALTGMAELFENDWAKAMPDWLLEDVGAWVYSLQDQDGFFYHPQWPKEFIEANNLQSRITRDKSSAKSLLKKIGITPHYSSYFASENGLTDKLGGSTVAAVSKAVYAADGMLWQYESVENFKNYLDGFRAEIKALDDAGNDAGRAWKFYYYGNLFQSTTSYMNAEMKKMTIDFFNEYQNEENGMWSKGLYYDSTNGIHKIGAVFNNIGAELQHIDKIVASTMEIINFDYKTSPSSSGVNIYNAWSCFPYIYTNIRKYSSVGTAAERDAKCEEIKAQVFENAAFAINNTYGHIVGMKQADGSFGYNRTGSSSHAQGCPAAVPGTKEGDVNGNAICSYDIVHYITLALELEAYEIPMFTEEDRLVFVNTITENAGRMPVEVGQDRFYDFEDVAVGSVPEEMTVSYGAGRNEIPGSNISVVEESDGNRALYFTMKHRGTDTNGRNYNVAIPVENLCELPSISRLEMSIMVLSENATIGNNICEITVSSERDGSCVILPRLGLSENGVVTIYDTAGDKIADIGSANQYIDLKIDYCWKKKVYMVYVDGELKGSASATYSGKLHYLAGQVTISSASTINASYLIDNIRFVNVQ